MRSTTGGLRLVVGVLLSGLLVPSVALADRQASQTKPAQTQPPQTAPVQTKPTPQRGIPSEDVVLKTRTGDLDELLKRRSIRILTPYSKTHYFIDKGVQRGIVHDAGQVLEAYVNKQLKTTPATKVHVVFVPTSRDALYDALVQGRGDVVAAGVIITPEREKLVDFAVPQRTNVNYVLVSGPGAPPVKTLDDLAGKQVAAREGGLALSDLTALNAKFKGEGKGQIAIKTVPGALEDEDVLEMVSSGLLKATVVDQAIADFWAQVLPGLTVHSDIVVRKGGSIAMAVRKGSPKLLALLNPFVEANRQGTLTGNELLRRYLRSTKFAKNATSDAELRKFKELVGIFQKYAGQYDLDYVLMMAQGYQESQLDQNAKSHVGAIGVMQVMPATAKDLKVGDVRQVDSNVHAGVKYIRFMIDEFFKDEPIDRVNKGLFAFAAYNCGPGRLRQLRKEAQTRGLNPNVWFNNVERIAGERVGRETVQYVSNIYKYYIAYTLTLDDWNMSIRREP
jgi:membrane-bound lytic murein transglycosylase MltF